MRWTRKGKNIIGIGQGFFLLKFEFLNLLYFHVSAQLFNSELVSLVQVTVYVRNPKFSCIESFVNASAPNIHLVFLFSFSWYLNSLKLLIGCAILEILERSFWHFLEFRLWCITLINEMHSSITAVSLTKSVFLLQVGYVQDAVQELEDLKGGGQYSVKYITFTGCYLLSFCSCFLFWLVNGNTY